MKFFLKVKDLDPSETIAAYPSFKITEEYGIAVIDLKDLDEMIKLNNVIDLNLCLGARDRSMTYPLITTIDDY
jgi:hypothetical protein